MSVLFGGEGQKERGEDAKGTKNSLHHSMPQDVGSEANAKTISSRISNLPRPLPPLPAYEHAVCLPPYVWMGECNGLLFIYALML